MNKVFKVIWSEARNAYVVVSEIAKNHGSKSCSTKKLLTMLIATGVMTCASMAPAMAANPAPDDLNVTIGKGAHVSVWNSVSGQTISGDIAVGPNAHAWNGEYTYRNKYARIGSKEYLLDFGQGGVVGAESIFGVPYKYKVADGSKIAGSIAIGKNTVARTGSVMLGDHSYTGKLGDIEINPANAMTYNDGIYSTTLGAGAYNSGSLAAVTGALSIASGSDTKNTGATIYGSLNSIESATSSSSYSGVASSVLGFANKTQNANAALIWGTGNEVTNSIEKVSIDTNWNNVSVAEAQQKAIEAMQSSDYAGGSVMAIGGGNKADYAKYSQLTGVQNKVTGTAKDGAKYDFVNGYQNTVTNASDVTVIGIKNEVTADGNKVIGDNHKVIGKDNVIFGSADADKVTETTVNNAVVLGHNAKVTGEGGVALGSGSVADRANAVSVGSKDAERQIINVKAGVKDTDAVNVSQLKDVKAEAGKHTQVKAGTNVGIVPSETDGTHVYTVNADGTTVSGDSNVVVTAGEKDANNVTNYGVKLNKDLQGIESVSNGAARLALSGATGTAGLINGKGASVFLMNDSTVINGVVGIDKTGKISRVANGEVSSTSTDAINGSQLHQTNQNVAQNAADIATNKANIAQNAADIATNKADIATNKANIEKNAADITQNKADIAQNKADIKNLDNRVTDVEEVAKKHTTVTKGDNIVVSEDTNADGGKEYKVALKNDITLAGDAGDFVSISGSKGTIWASGSVAAGNVVMDGATATVSGLSNKTTAYDGFANGKGKAATEEQLKEVATEAGKHSVVTEGANITVTPEQAEDGRMQYNVALKNDIKLAGDNDYTYVNISGSKGSVWASSSVAAGNVIMDGTTATVSGLGNTTTAYDGFATTGKAATEEQLKEVATEAGKHSKVVNGNNTNVEETTVDGQKVYKVNLNKDIMLGDLTGKNVSISGTNGTIETTGYIATKDRVYADKGAKLADIDVTGNKISNGASSIVLDGSNVKVNDKVTIDQNGNIAGVNSLQTNALNSKYNLSVGTMAENGIMPFFVNSTGDFYAAHNKFHVDKDGKVTATAGEIGNVVLQNGVYYGHSTLQDGSLLLTDDNGNHSYIDAKSAKLGKVTVAEDGKISGVAAGAITADSTDAVNGSQLHAVATEAGKHSKVVNGNNTNVEETTVDGQKVYKVNLNKDIMLGDLTGKNVSISGTNGTIETTGYIATKDRVYADKGAKLADIDVTGNKISNGASSIVLDGSNVKVNDKVTIDQNGNIAGVNSLQTNALNSKYNLSVGTMAENGIMPFFVNSTGDFYAAHNKFHVDKDGKVTATAGEIGNVVLQNGVYTGHSALRDGELFVGDASGNYSQITTKGAKLGKVTVAEDGKISGVVAGAVTADSTDAVNGSQLHAVATEAGKHSKVVNGSNINVEETDVDGQKIYKVNLNKDIMLGDLTGKYVNISGTNGTIETTGYIATKDRVYADKGAKLADIDVTGNKISNGASSIVLDGSNVKVNDKVTIDQNGKISGVAAGEISKTSTDAINGSQLNQTNENVAQNKADIAQNKADIAQNKADIAQNKADIAQNKADIATNKADIAQNKADIAQNKTDIKNLDNRVTNVEELAKKHTTVTAGDNITVAETTNADGGKEYKVALNKDISVDSVKAGDTTITDKGLEIKDGPSVTKDGINAGNKKITGVAKGEADTDAVNYGQLKETNNHIDRVENQVVSNTNRINQLGSRVNKVGAGAAALAALHPMDFDPDDKLTFSAGYGNYGGENAAAIGAYYRPDEKVMFSVGGTVGNGENMVNAGVSFSLDRTNHVSNSRTAMAREILDLRAEVTELKAMVAKGGLGSIAEDKMKIFPDVAENHWAYEYVGKLAAAGIIEGYPDGNFSGDRMMSRYEFAAMLYRAMQKGAQLDSKIINEFAPEMGRIRVDRISGEDGDRNKIERVRVNAVKGERDHYGNKIAKAEAKAK